MKECWWYCSCSYCRTFLRSTLQLLQTARSCRNYTSLLIINFQSLSFGRAFSNVDTVHFLLDPKKFLGPITTVFSWQSHQKIICPCLECPSWKPVLFVMLCTWPIVTLIRQLGTVSSLIFFHILHILSVFLYMRVPKFFLHAVFFRCCGYRASWKHLHIRLWRGRQSTNAQHTLT